MERMRILNAHKTQEAEVVVQEEVHEEEAEEQLVVVEVQIWIVRLLLLSTVNQLLKVEEEVQKYRQLKKNQIAMKKNFHLSQYKKEVNPEKEKTLLKISIKNLIKERS